MYDGRFIFMSMPNINTQIERSILKTDIAGKSVSGVNVVKDKFNDAVNNNRIIADVQSEYIIIANATCTNVNEIIEIVYNNIFLLDYDCVIFGENVPQGEVGWKQMLLSYNMVVYGMILRKAAFGYTGCFNEKLETGIYYELAIRMAYGEYNSYKEIVSVNQYGVFCVQCGADDTQFVDKSDNDISNSSIFFTYAYVIRRYMNDLKLCHLLDDVLKMVMSYADKIGYTEKFRGYINGILDNEKMYIDIVQNTAPYYIIIGDETCHGVLKRFALKLTDALINRGQAVITSDRTYSSNVSKSQYITLEKLESMNLKGVIGFQSIVLFRDYFKRFKCPKYIFWFDNPMYFRSLFHDIDNKYYFLCQDRYYAEFIKEYYGCVNSIQFPPAGEDAGYSGNDKRIYDVVFIGACNYVDDGCVRDDFQKEYYEYMKSNPDKTFEYGLSELLRIKNYVVDKGRFLDILESLADVCRNVVNYYRTKVLETILTAGIKVDVYGDTWDRYCGGGKENLIIHDAVTVDESLKVWGQAKIGLNVMTWHKAGMTERIANICMSGAVCLTERTDYLDKEFCNYGDIVMFDLKELKKLPDIIKKLLNDARLRSRIAENAYHKAVMNHTWDARAKEIIEMDLSEC